MPNRRKPQPSTVVYAAMHLTPAQIRRLETAAAEHLRNTGSHVAALLADELERPPRARSAPVRGASSRDRRRHFSVRITMPARMHRQLEKRAEAEMRSVSGCVARVIVEALASPFWNEASGHEGAAREEVREWR